MERVEILGVEIDNIDNREALERVRAMLREGGPHQIVTPAVEQIVLTRRDAEFREIVRQAALAVPDGMPVVFASRWNRTPLKERVTGVDLVPGICRVAAEEGASVFFLGGEEGVAEAAARVLSERVPGLKVAGTYCPPFGFERDEEENRRAIEAVRAARPGVLFVALGCPRQEKWIHRHRDELGATVAIGIGGAFNFITGREKRAPVWLQNLGLEGVYRLCQRPGQIWKRLIINAPCFLLLYFDLLTYRAQKRLTRSIRPMILGAVDALLATAGFVFSYWLYFRSGAFQTNADPFPDQPLLTMPAYSDLLGFVALLGVAAPFINRMYERDKYIAPSGLAWRSFLSASLAVFMLIGVQFLFKGVFHAYQFLGFSRVVFALFGASFFALLLGWRFAFRAFEHALHQRGLSLDRILIVGVTPLALQLADDMRQRPEWGNRPLGFVAEPSTAPSDAETLGRVADLHRLLPARKVDEVLVADSALPIADLIEVIRVCREHRVKLSIIPTLHELLGVSSEVKRLGGVRVITVALDGAWNALQSRERETEP
ncbi:MAG: WecB/TagA/CpsF family glycosyltransferase [bacterium]|nr:WecB/TagA/CpsF family glycosyltransferase [bacterium]